MEKIKNQIIQKIEGHFGVIKKVGKTLSLYHIPSLDIYIYFRYSIIHKKDSNKPYCFYGLRKEDIELMYGKKSYFCFLSDEIEKIFLIPFSIYESYFLEVPPSVDGQYKTNIHFKKEGIILDFANMPKFIADSYLGVDALFLLTAENLKIPQFSHNQIQSILAAIGILKGYEVWIPTNDKSLTDFSIVDKSKIINNLPTFRSDIDNIISEIDLIWLDKFKPISLFEVEHTTPIYSGLLRFNDVLLTISGINNFNIVANETKESLFGRQINRPTFKHTKLNEIVTFMRYENIYQWYHNLTGKYYGT